MPDSTRAENKAKNEVIKKLEKEMDTYYKAIAPYESARKLVHSYENRSAVMQWAEENYDEACRIIEQKEEAERLKSASRKKHGLRRQSND